MTVKTLAGQLAIRLAVVGAVLTAVGVTSYNATHWEPNMVNSPPIHAATRYRHDRGMDSLALDLLVGAAIAVGVAGVVIPLVPGLLLIWGAVLAWALATDADGRWVVLALVTAIAGLVQVVKYLVPARRMRDAGVPTRTVLVGAALGIVGFFVIPVLGLPLGFVGGVYAAERVRVGDHAAARRSTVEALKAGLLSILIELAASLVCAAIWLAGAIAA
jgi:uncharacterized protein YqgC (DUF456 family)